MHFKNLSPVLLLITDLSKKEREATHSLSIYSAAFLLLALVATWYCCSLQAAASSLHLQQAAIQSFKTYPSSSLFSWIKDLRCQSKVHGIDYIQQMKNIIIKWGMDSPISLRLVFTRRTLLQQDGK